MKGLFLNNRILFVFCLVVAVCSNSCSKIASNQCTYTYEVDGRLLDGKSKTPIIGLNVNLSGTTKNIFGNNTWQSLGSFTIVNNGYFGLNYKCNTNYSSLQLNFNVDSPYIISLAHLTVPLYSKKSVDIPVNTNIRDLIYYVSDSGTLRIFVQPAKPIKPTDTLLVQILNKQLEFIGPKSGLIDSVRIPAFVHVFTKNHLFWGVGRNQLDAAMKLNEYDSDPHKIDFDLKGDPYVTDINLTF